MISWQLITQGYKVTKKMAIKYAPQILTGVGIFCMGAATVKAIKTAPKAKEAIDKIEADDSLTHKEYVKKKTLALMKFYWPEFLMTFGGAGLIIGGQHISIKRLGIATAIISSRNEEIKDLKDKIAEKYGDKELGKIQDSIAQDKAKKALNDIPTDLSTVYNTGHGTTLFYDIIGKRSFLSDLEYIRKMRDQFNKEIAEQMQRGDEAVMSLNDWYDYNGLPQLDGRAENGKKVGPNIGKDLGWRNRLMELKFTSDMLSNGQTYFVMGFTDNGGPKWDLDITDDYGSRYSDDETDMPSRGRRY